MSRGAWLRLAISFGISAVLLAAVLRSIDRDRAAAALGEVDWRVLPVAIALFFIAVWVRSVRWGLLLPQQSVSRRRLFQTLVVGLTVNNVLPMRMGEVARVYLLGRWASVPYGSTLASLVAERILDGLSLALLLLVSLRLLPTPPPEYLSRIGAIFGAAFLAGALLVGVGAWRSDAILTATRWLVRPLPKRLAQLAERLASSFAGELAFVRGAHRLGLILGLSIVAWCFELGLFYVLMIGFPLPASVPLAFLVGSAANFATLVPSSPGYVGTFDGALIKVLSDSAGVRVDLGLAGAYALVVHATLFLPVIILGTLVLWRSHMSFQQITHAADEGAQQEPSGDWSAAA